MTKIAKITIAVEVPVFGPRAKRVGINQAIGAARTIRGRMISCIE